MAKYRIEEIITKSGYSQYIIQQKHYWIDNWADTFTYNNSNDRVIYTSIEKAKEKLEKLKADESNHVTYHY